MKTRKDNLLTLDKFIEESLYNKKNGYYMKKNPFGAKGDFITSPNISILFSEMVAIWIISFWENLKCPNKFNLIELGAGNGEMMKTLISTFKKFPKFKKSCDIKIFEKKIQFKISQNQKFIEYSFLAAEYLKIITSKIKYNSGGILIIDYGYNDKKIKNTLQAVSKHKYINVLKGFKNSDITYNLNLNLFNQIIKKFGTFNFFTTNQKNFLTKLGILKRAEILSKNMTFSNKVNVYFRVKRLIDEKQMGDLFKVIFITNKKNKFKLGF